MTTRFVVCLAAFLAATCHAADGDALYARGMERYQAGDYGAAYTALAAAADAGHTRAQEIAGFMALLGPALYGADVEEDYEAGVRRLSQAAERGSDAARHALCAYLRHDSEKEGLHCRLP